MHKQTGILKQTLFLQLLLKIIGKCLQPSDDKNFI